MTSANLINVSLCRFQCTYLSTDGGYMSGTVTFTPNVQYILDPDTMTIIAPTPVSIALDNFGFIDITVPATDDPDLNPVGWTYQVTEDLVDTHGNVYNNSYAVSAPSDAVINLAERVPIPSYFGDYYLRGPRGADGDSPGFVDGGSAGTDYALELDGGTA